MDLRAFLWPFCLDLHVNPSQFLKLYSFSLKINGGVYAKTLPGSIVSNCCALNSLLGDMNSKERLNHKFSRIPIFPYAVLSQIIF